MSSGNDDINGRIVGGQGTHTRPWKVEDARNLRTRRLQKDDAVNRYLNHRKNAVEAVVPMIGGGSRHQYSAETPTTQQRSTSRTTSHSQRNTLGSSSSTTHRPRPPSSGFMPGTGRTSLPSSAASIEIEPNPTKVATPVERTSSAGDSYVVDAERRRRRMSYSDRILRHAETLPARPPPINTARTARYREALRSGSSSSFRSHSTGHVSDAAVEPAPPIVPQQQQPQPQAPRATQPGKNVDLDESNSSQNSVNDKIAAFEQLSSWGTLDRKRTVKTTVDDASSATTPESNTAVVDQYLAQRQRLKEKTSAMVRIGAKHKAAPPNPAPPTVVSSSSSSEEDEDEVEDNNMENGSDPHNAKSVKVCIISAVDVPASVVPNLPFAPYIRLSLAGQSRRTSSKIMSKRDNGAVEFHEEIRFDGIAAETMTLELASRTVMGPANQKESPPPHNSTIPKPAVPSAELEQAQAAAAVAQLLVGGETHTNEWNVTLRQNKRKRKKRRKPTKALVIGRTEISLQNLLSSDQTTARMEQWVTLDDQTTGSSPTKTQSSPSHGPGRRSPSILLEITVSTREDLDDSEDDMEGTASYSKRVSAKIRKQLQQEFHPDEETTEEPTLEPGIIDYICIVGARDIGNQKADDGSRGWVQSQPECCVLEQFPPDDFHTRNGRSTVLPGKVEWFCFPEGCRLWRGFTPPNPDELNLKRFSGSSPSTVSGTVASFDACLNCTSSFSWFVVSANSEEYGSETRKTYGAVIRFFVPAPAGVDPTQDDFGQMEKLKDSTMDTMRLWVPVAVCVTSSLPIIGTMEVLLLRLCESLSPNGVFPQETSSPTRKQIFYALSSLIVHCQKPIPGIVNCSFPFLHGDRLHVSLPAPKGLPPLPHGNCVTAVCRLLGADGLNYLFAAFLSECKILLHSDDVATLCMVAEVMTTLLYPFQWSLPYIPVLPLEMMEIVEAPVSFLLGIPSCNLDLIDPNVLEDIVVVDLDKGFNGSETYGSARLGVKSKVPPPLPAVVASNISKAVYTLLRAQDEIDKAAAMPTFAGERLFPRTESETAAEREFRISVAMEVCSLIQGFDDCLVFSSAQPVFNVDKFLQNAPSIFEEPRAAGGTSQAQHQPFKRVVSARARRFVSTLVCCQHFHQFLEMLDSDSLSMFHALMRAVTARSSNKSLSLAGKLLSLDPTRSTDELCTFLQNMEDKTPTFRVPNFVSRWETCLEGVVEDSDRSNFPIDLLRQIQASGSDALKSNDEHGVKSISMEYLVELEKNPWRYQGLFAINPTAILQSDGSCRIPPIEKVSIREALGARRYRAWKSSTLFDGEDSTLFSEDSKPPTHLDLTSLLLSVATEETASISSEGTDEQSSAKDREAVRRCLASVRVSSGHAEENDRGESKQFGLVTEAEEAMKRSRVAQRFFLDVLNERLKQSKDILATPTRKKSQHTNGSKVDWDAFEVLMLLSFALLSVFEDDEQFDSAYDLLKLTAGIHSTSKDSENDVTIVYLTERIGLHPIFSNLSVWERVCRMHRGVQKASNQQEARHQRSGTDEKVEDEYGAVVATLYEMNGYGIPAEELAKFASRMCENNGWYSSEKGQTLLMLAKRASARRDQIVAASTPSRVSDFELMSPPSTRHSTSRRQSQAFSVISPLKESDDWHEVAWCHPAAHSTRRHGKNSDGNKRGISQSLVQKLDDTKSATSSEGGKYMKRSAVTSLAYLGSSIVVSGGLDGGVFMARRIKRRQSDQQDDIRGVHLDWGSSGSRYSVGSASTSLDGEYGVGAVTCITATKNNLHSANSVQKDTMDPLEDEELLNAMDGCRVVAGTTCGDLRVWSIKDVYSAVFYSARGGDLESFSPELPSLRHSTGATSTFMNERRAKASEFAAGSSLTRLKFSLRGRALSGHRGGVGCITLHSNLYRPDSVVTGGADGLIKLWSLRTPGSTGSRRASFDTTSLMSPPSREKFGVNGKGTSRTGDAINILTGHGGRVLCVKTAWHGDRLLSGGADRTVRLWDLASGNGKCLHTLSGHFGWVTSVKFWGPNTLISTSTDRSVALWDARVSSAPLFVLRHHHAPISDTLISPRSDPVMISAAMDGSVACWDFRELSGTVDVPAISPASGKSRPCQVVRAPASVAPTRHPKSLLGPQCLSKGISESRRTILYTGADSVLREWDYDVGEIVAEHTTGHCDSISRLCTLRDGKVLDNSLENSGNAGTSTITASNDGTIRLRTLRRGQ